MSEIGELPNKEQVVVPQELQSAMTEATAAVGKELQDPAAQVAQPTEQLSMFAELGKLGKETAVRRLGLMFKDAKAALGIVPFINKVSEAITPTETVGKTISAAVTAENTMVAAEKEATSSAKAFDRANERFMKLSDTSPKLEKAALDAGNKLTAQMEADSVLKGAQQVYRERLDTATQRLNSITSPPKEGKVSKFVRKNIADIHKDSDYLARFEAAKVRATELNADLLAKAAKKGTDPGKVKLFAEADVMRWTGNGEMPARTGWEKAGRGAKKVGMHLLLENLGPIINPVPDVPPLVSLASYGAEAFGGQWWAGLVPPVWQYLHNRVEDFQIGWESSTKSMEIIRRHWNMRIDRLEEKKIEKAANVFLPKQVVPMAV